LGQFLLYFAMQIYQLSLTFKGQEYLLEQRFFNSDLGRIYQAIPLDELAKNIPAPARAKSGLGRKPWLSVKGGIGLMFLKHYLNLSDEKLLQRLNTDWCMRHFCGLPLDDSPIRSKNLVWQWRAYLGQHIDLDKMQKTFVEHWKPYMNETQVGMSDATVYESYIRYPNDIVLLWESCEQVYNWIRLHCRQHKIRRPRIRFERQKERYLNHQRRRKRSARRNKRVRNGLTKFLIRLLERFDELNVQLKTEKGLKRLQTIRQLRNQQQNRMMNPEQKITNRIVSIHKPYVRPIVRGKEVKPVEFGAKVNLLQVDGINFIEHLSYDAFNEGKRMISSIRKQRDYFGKCQQFGADKIYATNANRKYCTKYKIATCFVPKGKPNQQYKEQARDMRQQLGKQRATVLEGSFGNEKNHYLLNKVKAHDEPSEKAWIFFGIMTANAVTMSRRILSKKKLKQAA